MVRYCCSSVGIWCVALLLGITAPLESQEIGFAESFALAPDRQEALRQLTPGTEDYYYYQTYRCVGNYYCDNYCY